MSLDSLSDKLVFKTLANIKVGYLEITDYEGKQLKFGNPEDSLKAKLKIKKPNFTFNYTRSYCFSFYN